jgi:hypothetical protein
MHLTAKVLIYNLGTLSMMYSLSLLLTMMTKTRRAKDYLMVMSSARPKLGCLIKRTFPRNWFMQSKRTYRIW